MPVWGDVPGIRGTGLAPFVGRAGFEPTKSVRQQIYSLPPLAIWVSPQYRERSQWRTRTHDRLITNQLLYQLSYIGVYSKGKERTYTRLPDLPGNWGLQMWKNPSAQTKTAPPFSGAVPFRCPFRSGGLPQARLALQHLAPERFRHLVRGLLEALAWRLANSSRPGTTSFTSTTLFSRS